MSRLERLVRGVLARLTGPEFAYPDRAAESISLAIQEWEREFWGRPPLDTSGDADTL